MNNILHGAIQGISYLSKGSCKSPKPTKATSLQVVEGLVGCVLVFTTHEVEYDCLDCVEDNGLVTQRQHVRDLGVQEGVAV